MTLNEIGLKDGNHFVAMEYYGLILNRTFLFLITKEHLIGLKVNGMVSSNALGADPLTAIIASSMAIYSDLENPYSYIKSKYLKKIKNLDINGEEILMVSKSNFKISKKDISNVEYDSSKKWGMGEYPHDGKVKIRTSRGERREFIILGAQSGEQIANRITNYN